MEKQKKWKFNVIDALFLLVVLAGIAFAVYQIAGPRLPADLLHGSAAEEDYVVTYYCAAVPDYQLDHLRQDAAVTDDGMTRDYGTVVDFQLGQSKFYAADESGRMTCVSRDDYHSLLLMCRVRGRDNGFGISADGIALGVGHSLAVRADEVRIDMTVYNIQKLSDTAYAS